MKKCAVFLVCDENLVFAMANMVLQLSKYDFIDSIIIYLDSKNDIIKQVIKDCDSRVEFYDIEKNNIAKMLNFDIANNNFINTYGLITFARFYAFDLLDQYENVILLDVDILILKNFQDIMSGKPISYKPYMKLNIFCDVPEDVMIPNAGVIVINKSIKKYITNCVEECFSIVNKFYTVNHLDEVVYGYLVYKYNIDVDFLDQNKYNVSPFYKNSRNAYIVHGASPYKFWSNPICDTLFPEWRNYNDKWNVICDNNKIYNFKCHMHENIFSEKYIFNMDSFYNIYNKLYKSNDNIYIRFDKHWDFIKVCFRDIKESFHLEIKQYANMCRVFIHDEDPIRVKSNIFLNLFYGIISDIPKKNIKIYSHRFEAFWDTPFDKLDIMINNLYELIKNKLLSYFYIDSIYSKLEYFDKYIVRDDGVGANIFKFHGNKIDTYDDTKNINIQCSNKKCYIFIEDGCILYNVKFICGENDIIIIRKSHNRGMRNLIIDNGHVGGNRIVYIDENCSCESMRIVMANESFLTCVIGKNCMISSDVTIRATDGHVIYDKNNKIVNCGKHILIGEHVWIGSSATILKGAIIGNNCIVGTGTVVTGKKYPDKTVVSGNPARIVRENVNWDRTYLG